MNMKVIGGLVVAVLLVVAGGMYFAVQNIDGIVKGLIEEVGTEVTGSSVVVGDVKLKLSDGSGTITGLRIANPEGFSKANIFEIDKVTLGIDPGSLTGPVYVLNEVEIDGARVLAEQNMSGTNIEVMKKNIEQAAQRAVEQLGLETEAVAEDDSEEIRLMVSKFRFVNSSAKLKTEQFGEHELAVPGINLSNLGTREKGLTPEELAMEAVSALVKQVQKAVSDKVKKLAEDATMEAIESKLSAEDKEKVNKFKSLFKKK